METKRCYKCLKIKELSEFYKHKGRKDGRKAECKLCSNKVSVESTKEKRTNLKISDPEKLKQVTRESSYKSKYGITIGDFDSILESQNGVCDICKEKVDITSNMHVDHNHETGEIRGLLCRKCNVGLGFFDENIKTLQNAITYLNKYN